MSTDSLLQTARAIAPDVDWKASSHLGFGATAGIDSHLPDGRWLRVEQHERAPIYHVDVSRLISETPLEEGSQTPTTETRRFYASRTWVGDAIGEPLASAVADALAPQELLGLRLYPSRPVFGGQGWQDETERYKFVPSHDGGWEWELHGRIPSALGTLLSGFHKVGSKEPTLPEAVAAALAAPQRIGALLMVLTEEYGRPAAPVPWVYAGQVTAKDGERVVAGPYDDLLAAKDGMSAVEKPFYGRMNTDESFIVGVRGMSAATLDAETVLAHPAGRRLKRY